MRIVLTVVLAAALTGCFSMSAQELRDDVGKPHTAASTQPPDRAAGCIARRVEEGSQGFVPSVRSAEKPGAWEVVVRTPSALASYVLYALAEPAATGSTLSAWGHGSIWHEIARKAVTGC